MIAGLILGLIISAGSALLLPLLFPAEATKPKVSRDLHRASRTALELGRRLERVSQEVAEESDKGAVSSRGAVAAQGSV